jgi:hypothetical protein
MNVNDLLGSSRGLFLSHCPRIPLMRVRKSTNLWVGGGGGIPNMKQHRERATKVQCRCYCAQWSDEQRASDASINIPCVFSISSRKHTGDSTELAAISS